MDASKSSTPKDTSPSSTASSSALDSMQIFVKNVAGETSALTIRPETTISELKLLIEFPSSTLTEAINPQDLRLIHAGRHLSSPTATLPSLAIPAGSTIHIALPLLGGNDDKDAERPESGAATPVPATASATATPSKAKSAAARKPRCGFKNCKEKIQPIVGDCGFCKGRFCAKHRMLESHSCEGLEDCKDEARERNREQLEKERTRPLQAL